jgi:hypothetical protein
MNKEFISHQEALELKQLGFDEPCLATYHKELHTIIPIYAEYTNQDVIKAPLYQQAFRWFRDKKLSDASINRHGKADGGYSYRWEIVHEYGTLEERHFKMGYTTYEEAELACLNKLIEIVKGGDK